VRDVEEFCATTIAGATTVDGGRKGAYTEGSMGDIDGPVVVANAFRLRRKQNQRRNDNMRTSTKPPPSAPPTMEPVGGA
jgi:hypothetical protein